MRKLEGMTKQQAGKGQIGEVHEPGLSRANVNGESAAPVDPHTVLLCRACGSRSIEVGPDGNLLDHYRPGSIWGVCYGPRDCPCDDGDGEGCPEHGDGSVAGGAV